MATLKLLLARMLGLHRKPRRKPFSIESPDGKVHHFDHKPKRAREFKRWLRSVLLPCACLLLAVGAKATTVPGSDGGNSGIVRVLTVPATALARSSVTCLGTSTLVFAANPARKRIDCFTLDTNTSTIYAEWDLPAVSTSVVVLPANANYIESSTGAFSCMSVAGTQVIRCYSY